MCLIWKNKKTKTLSIEELQATFQDDLFSGIAYVGVSGGEPTLRTDLPDVFRAICSAFPNLKGVGIITNGIIETSVKNKILDIARVCDTFAVPFNVMFSLDGIGDVHDIVRGRSNNYDSVWSLINYFHRETDIPTSFGCTISASNALYVDELLDLVASAGIYGRFRVAEFIQRLYNDDQS
ncbi:MAG: radical SAM protein, partial [Bacteroidota bacterium]